MVCDDVIAFKFVCIIIESVNFVLYFLYSFFGLCFRVCNRILNTVCNDMPAFFVKHNRVRNGSFSHIYYPLSFLFVIVLIICVSVIALLSTPCILF